MFRDILYLVDYKVPIHRRDDLRKIHSQFELKSHHFNQLKHYFIKEMMVMNIPSNHLLKCITSFERFRNIISSEVGLCF
jgi:hypothetical protein